MDSPTAKYLVHHIFLPPKLPHEDDTSALREAALLDTTLRCILKFRSHVPETQRCCVESAIQLIQRLCNVHERNGDFVTISDEGLRSEFSYLCKHGWFFDSLCEPTELTATKADLYRSTSVRRTQAS